MQIFQRVVKIARKLLHLPSGKSKHFAFLLSGRKIIGVGWNQHRTHPYLQRWGVPGRPPAIHAEAAAIFSSQKAGNALIVMRLNRSGELRYSRPCECCRGFLLTHGITKIWYSTERGFLGV